jgi:5-methylcytosine-specific restriction endonuclease McrA
MSESKPCRRCGEELHWTGSRWRCTSCNMAYQRKRRESLTPERREAERVRDNENRNSRRTQWAPEKRAEVNGQITAWREANRERHRAGSRDWYHRNEERARAAKLAEYYADRESFYARNLVRKARIADAVCEHGPKCVTAEFLKDIYAEVCIYCGAQAQHADHFYPLVRGGLHCVDNIVPSCQRCNNSKCARDPLEFMASG